jgi:uncharacterized cupredoxin-like copper-binding protein
MILMPLRATAWVLAVSAVLGIPIASAYETKQEAAHSAHSDAVQSEPFGQPGVAKNVARTIAITLSDTMRFTPDKLSIKQGETVRLRITNAGKIPHEFVLGTKEELAEHAQMMRQMPGMVHSDASSVQVAPGKSADIVWNFSKSGNFLFACLIPGHRESGMEGSVTVTVTKPPAR